MSNPKRNNLAFLVFVEFCRVGVVIEKPDDITLNLEKNEWSRVGWNWCGNEEIFTHMIGEKRFSCCGNGTIGVYDLVAHQSQMACHAAEALEEARHHP